MGEVVPGAMLSQGEMVGQVFLHSTAAATAVWAAADFPPAAPTALAGPGAMEVMAVPAVMAVMAVTAAMEATAATPLGAGYTSVQAV